MKTMIAFLMIAFLLPTFVKAQSTDTLGDSCTLKYKSLTIPQIPQKWGSSWCWAAAAQNVMGFYQTKYKPPTTKQCDIVNKDLNYYEHKYQNLECCAEEFNDCMSEGGSVEEIFDLPDYQFSYKPLEEKWEKLDWKRATEEICRNRPFISTFDLLFDDAHMVVIHGYRIKDGIQELRVFDPILRIDPDRWESYYNYYDDTHLGDTFDIQPKK